MRAVRTEGTAPELLVRKILSDLGVAYRLNVRSLPGTPDLANKSKEFAIFVHGCFWHRHEGCPLSTTPASNVAFWSEKFRGNVVRDRLAIEKCGERNMAVLVVWECETRHADLCRAKIVSFLNRAGVPDDHDKE